MGGDFGGQALYRPTHQLFFTAPAIYLALWHPRRGVEGSRLLAWIEQVRQRADDAAHPEARPRILVVATHAEGRSDPFDRQPLQERFGDLIVGFYRVDSATGLGLDELKGAIAKTAAALPSVGRWVPQSWKRLLRAVAERGAREPVIPEADFLLLCEEQGIDAELGATYLAMLNELGHLIHYADDPLLREQVVLRPEYLSKAISFVLEDGATQAAHGLLAHDRLGAIWDDPARPARERYPAALHPLLLRLMARFDLCYRVAMPDPEDPATSLVAQLVQGERPAHFAQAWPEAVETGEAGERTLTRVCRVVERASGRPGVVDGLLYRLIVRLQRYALGREDYRQSCHWQRGLVVADGVDGRALIEWRDGDLQITVRGAYPEGFLGYLTREIRVLITQHWRGLELQEWVLCVPPCSGLHAWEELLELKREGIDKSRCSSCKRRLQIDDLLAAPPKLSMGEFQAALDKLLTRTDTIDSKLSTVVEQGDETRAGVRALIAQANEQFDLLLEALIDPAKEGPRLFSFEPVKPGFWDKPAWIAERFRLTLWCEHARLPLPLVTDAPEQGVYEIEFQRAWVERAAPLLWFLSKSLGLALSYAGRNELEISAAARQAFEPPLAFAKACAEQFRPPELASEAWGEWLSESEVTGSPSSAGRSGAGQALRAAGAELREFHGLLRQKDPNQHFGGLVRVHDKRRFLWVHKQFVGHYHSE